MADKIPTGATHKCNNMYYMITNGSMRVWCYGRWLLSGNDIEMVLREGEKL